MKKAYLIVDMSNDFVDSGGSLTAGAAAQAIVPSIMARIKEFFAQGELIVFCMDNHSENDPHFRLWTPHNVIGSWGAGLYGELSDWYEAHRESENVVFLPKSEYDAFYRTELGELLSQNEIKEVYVSGVCTDICVENTVYGAYKLGYPTFVARDECATFTDNQEIFLSHMNMVYKTTII